MFTNKTKNSNNYYLNTTHTNPNYSSRSAPINIPHLPNRLSRLYIHNPLRNQQNRFINVDLNSHYNNSLENEANTIYATIESPPQRIGSSTFYVENESANSESTSSILTESDDEESIYETIDLPPSLPPRNRLRSFDEFHDQIQFDDNPNYSSFDDHKYETLRPKLPPRRNSSQVSWDENPCYESVETPPLVPVRDLHFHTEFRQKYCNQ